MSDSTLARHPSVEPEIPRTGGVPTARCRYFRKDGTRPIRPRSSTMLSPAMQEALNRRLTNEFAASQLYLSLAAYFEEQNLRGFGHWMRVQSMEEHMHGLRLFDLILSRGGRVRIEAVPAPPADFTSPLAAAEQALAREETVSRDFNELYQL